MFEYLVPLAVFGSFVANFPAIYKILKTKKAKDLSLLTSSLWVLITLIFTIHGMEINDIYFVISNFVMFIINVIIVILIWKYGR